MFSINLKNYTFTFKAGDIIICDGLLYNYRQWKRFITNETIKLRYYEIHDYKTYNRIYIIKTKQEAK